MLQDLRKEKTKKTSKMTKEQTDKNLEDKTEEAILITAKKEFQYV